MTGAIRAHKQAVIDRLHENEVLAGCGHEGVVLPDPASGARPERYWTIFTDSGRRFAHRAAGLQTAARFTYTLHWVGSTPEQAQALAELGMALLVDFQLTVTGYRCGRLQHTTTVPTGIDDSIRPPLHFGVDQFDLETQPLP